jgi:hypothetical protein
MDKSTEANFMMILSIVFPIVFIIASKWLVPLLEKKVGEKAKTLYFVIVFVIIIAVWYLIDKRYGFHMGLW